MLVRARLALLVPLVFASVAAATERPPPKSTSPLASPVAEVHRVGTEYAGKAYYDSLSEDLRQKLDKDGEVLIGDQAKGDSYAGYIRAIAIFKQPKKRAFELMTDPSKQVQFLPRLKSSTTINRTPVSELTEFAIKVMLSTYHFRVQHWFYPEQSRLEWKLDDSFKNDIKSQEGYWQLFELDENTTIGEYGTRVDTGLAVPRFIQTMFARSDIPKAMRAMRNYVNSNGTWHRDD